MNDQISSFQFVTQSYTASFNVKDNNDENVEWDNKSAYYGDTLSQSEEPMKAGYTFTGWNTAANGTGETWDFTSMTMPARNVILYAIFWKDDNVDHLFAGQTKMIEYGQNQEFVLTNNNGSMEIREKTYQKNNEEQNIYFEYSATKRAYRLKSKGQYLTW